MINSVEAFVFDLGGTFLRSSWVDRRGGLGKIKKETIRNFTQGYVNDDIWLFIEMQILDYITNNSQKAHATIPIVIAFPGPVTPQGRILQAPTINGVLGALPDLRARIESASGHPVFILNDISAAAWYFSSILPQSRFMVVTISSGIGSKIFDRGRSHGVLDDCAAYSGEIGHVTVDFNRDALLCDCGGSGHLGGISSGRGIERLARSRAQEDVQAFSASLCVKEWGATLNSISNENHLVPAILAKDRWAMQILEEGIRPLARVLSILTLGAGLECIVIIGGFATTIGQPFLDILWREMKKSLQYGVFDRKGDDFLILGDANEEACLMGAAIYARHAAGKAL